MKERWVIKNPNRIMYTPELAGFLSEMAWPCFGLASVERWYADHGQPVFAGASLRYALPNVNGEKEA